jgi:hypothetical protein
MRVSSIRWGIIWIGIGLLFLAINFGVLDSLVFPALFSLWPILLIAIGVELIFRKTKFYFLALLSPLLIAAAFVFAAVYAGGYSWNFSEFWKDWSWTYEGEKYFTEEISLDSSVDTIKLEMDLGETDIELHPSSGEVFSVKANYFKRSPIVKYRKEGATVYLEYRNRESSNTSIFRIRKREILNDINIYNGAWLYADIEIKMKYPLLDFSNFKLKWLNLSLKARESKIKLGDNIDGTRIEMKGKSEKLVLSAPQYCGLEILMDDIDIEKLENIEGFYRFSDGFRTEGFQDAEIRATVVLDLIVKNIDVHRN